MAGHISPRDWWVAGILALPFPWAWLALLAASLVRKEKWPAVLLALTVPTWAYCLQLPRTRYRDPQAFRVMSCNADYFNNVQQHDRVSNQKTMHEVIRFVNSEQPDVLCGQDFSGDSFSEKPLLDYLTQQLPYWIQASPSLTTYSRYPIVDWQAYWYPNSDNSYLRVDLNVHGKRIRVFNVHLQSYALAETRTPRQLASKFKWGLKDRAEQAEWLAQEIGWSKIPVIVCGDFNDPPTSYAYRTVSKGLTDAFFRKGRGLGFTYAGYIPLLKIDYVLCSKEIEVLDCYVNRSTRFSDHYPIISDLRF